MTYARTGQAQPTVQTVRLENLIWSSKDRSFRMEQFNLNSTNSSLLLPSQANSTNSSLLLLSQANSISNSQPWINLRLVSLTWVLPTLEDLISSPREELLMCNREPPRLNNSSEDVSIITSNLLLESKDVRKKTNLQNTLRDTTLPDLILPSRTVTSITSPTLDPKLLHSRESTNTVSDKVPLANQ